MSSVSIVCTHRGAPGRKTWHFTEVWGSPAIAHFVPEKPSLRNGLPKAPRFAAPTINELPPQEREHFLQNAGGLMEGLDLYAWVFHCPYCSPDRSRPRRINEGRFEQYVGAARRVGVPELDVSRLA